MWAQKEEKEFWLRWLNRYRSLRCLWDEDEKRQAGRNTRNEAYQELAELAKCINPNADAAFVRSRINAFRTCYRREFKKVEAAKANGITYTPQLFYYDTIKQFVNPETDLFDDKTYDESELENDPISSPERKDNTIKTIVKNESLKKVLNDYLSSDFESAISENKTKTKPNITYGNKTAKTPSKENVQIPNLKRRYASTEATDSLDYDDFDEQSNHPNLSIENVTSRPKEREHDEYDILGKRIAEHFRNMTSNQRLLAEKIISDVCIYGRMERLTFDSTLVLSEDQGVASAQPDEVDYDNPETFIYTS